MERTRRPPGSSHLAWVDIARGLGILAVVLWHTAGGILRRDPAGSPDLNRIVDAWDAYAYRAMPLFFLISGMFVVGSLRRPNQDFIENKLRTLLWPYIVWSLASVVAGTIAGSASVYGIDARDVPRLLYDPLLQFWFLYALVVVMLGYMALFRAGAPTRRIAVLAAGLYVGTIVLDLGSVSYVLAQIGLFSVYFAVGADAGPSVTAFVDRARRPLLVAITCSGAAFLALLTWWGPLPPPAWLPLLSATIATVAFVALAKVLDQSRFGRVFMLLGRYSLQIYVAQIIFASATRVALTRVGVADFWPQFLVASAVGLTAPIGLARLSERLAFPYLWVWPSHGRETGADGSGRRDLAMAGASVEDRT